MHLQWFLKWGFELIKALAAEPQNHAQLGSAAPVAGIPSQPDNNGEEDMVDYPPEQDGGMPNVELIRKVLKLHQHAIAGLQHNDGDTGQ